MGKTALNAPTDLAAKLGQFIRDRRKALGVPATVAAESAGMSRITWHRIERGTTTVTLAAWLNALEVLDLTMQVAVRNHDSTNAPAETVEGMLPVQIRLAEYPQLKSLAWQLPDTATLTPREALSTYERNWRHLDVEQLESREQHLIEALRAVFKEGAGDV